MAKYVPGELPSEIPAGYIIVQRTETGYICLTKEDMEKGNTIDLAKIDLTKPFDQPVVA